MEQEDLTNITQILNEEQLGENGPVRILVQGHKRFNLNVDNCNHPSLFFGGFFAPCSCCLCKTGTGTNCIVADSSFFY